MWSSATASATVTEHYFLEFSKTPEEENAEVSPQEEIEISKPHGLGVLCTRESPSVRGTQQGCTGPVSRTPPAPLTWVEAGPQLSLGNPPYDLCAGSDPRSCWVHTLV